MTTICTSYFTLRVTSKREYGEIQIEGKINGKRHKDVDMRRYGEHKMEDGESKRED